MRFEFATATQIVFGAGVLAEAGTLARPWGQRALVVTGSRTERSQGLQGLLRVAGIDFELFSVKEEPSTSTIEEGLDYARRARAEMVIGFGGGSVLDTAKAIAGLLTNSGSLLDYLEVVGRGKPLTQPAAPWMAIPTTAGTGSEVTRNAVLSVPREKIKVSLRSPLLLARVALVDPALTVGLPPEITASTGMDALTQLLEAYVCTKANPLTDALCVTQLPKVASALPLAWREPDNLAARTALSLGSLTSGLALANAGLGAVHGFAAPIGGLYSAPHGAICAALLAPVMEANLAALAKRAPESHALARYHAIAQWLTGNSEAEAADGVAWVRARVSEFRIPRLSEFGLSSAAIPEVAQRAQKASSMKANPIALTTDELEKILWNAL